ncbi:hypothetical protein [Paenibacillus odorifer]|uniref:hypothetical protein n=1 Tax=Paenibacillus odorifer TaxID=189426 RepID=UPI0013A6E10E|nr:hypothetical protein [Paenibacillus odorifer]
MKKIKIVFMLIFIFAVMPISGVHAYPEGLLDGKLMTEAASNTTTSKLTDNDLSTNENLYSYLKNRVFTYQFSEETTINAYQFHASDFNRLEIRFYDSAGKIISNVYEPHSSYKGVKVNITPIPGVKTVSISSAFGDSLYLYEFDVFGVASTPTPTATPVPTSTPNPTVTPTPTPTATPVPTSTPSPTATPSPTPTVTPKPTATPEQPSGDRAILTVTLINGTEKEYDLPMSEVEVFLNWYDARDAGRGPGLYAIDKHTNNKGPFNKRKDYVVFDKILTFEVSEYTIQ